MCSREMFEPGLQAFEFGSSENIDNYQTMVSDHWSPSASNGVQKGFFNKKRSKCDEK